MLGERSSCVEPLPTEDQPGAIEKCGHISPGIERRQPARLEAGHGLVVHDKIAHIKNLKVRDDVIKRVGN